jgi:hypothetical protein
VTKIILVLTAGLTLAVVIWIASAVAAHADDDDALTEADVKCLQAAEAIARATDAEVGNDGPLPFHRITMSRPAKGDTSVTLKCGDSKESPYLTADWEEPPASDGWLDFISKAGEVLTGVPAAKILPMAKKCYARALANEFLPFETTRRVRVECSAYKKGTTARRGDVRDEARAAARVGRCEVRRTPTFAKCESRWNARKSMRRIRNFVGMCDYGPQPLENSKNQM